MRCFVKAVAVLSMVGALASGSLGAFIWGAFLWWLSDVAWRTT